jgi:endonuclease III
VKQGSAAIAHVYRILMKEFTKHRMPVVDLIEVQTRDPFKVLVTTILSARTRDETTAAVSERLFKQISTPADLRALNVRDIEKLIYPVGFFREKAKHLKALPDRLDTLFGGKIPDTVEALVQLPGVGRKTANLVVAVAFNKPAICVDIHVFRITNRLGYVKTKNPLETEMRLRQCLPVKYWTTFNSCFVSFGQNTCFPVNPRCDRCPVYRYCDRVGVVTKYQRDQVV